MDARLSLYTWREYKSTVVRNEETKNWRVFLRPLKISRWKGSNAWRGFRWSYEVFFWECKLRYQTDHSAYVITTSKPRPLSVQDYNKTFCELVSPCVCRFLHSRVRYNIDKVVKKYLRGFAQVFSSVLQMYVQTKSRAKPRQIIVHSREIKEDASRRFWFKRKL